MAFVCLQSLTSSKLSSSFLFKANKLLKDLDLNFLVVGSCGYKPSIPQNPYDYIRNLRNDICAGDYAMPGPTWDFIDRIGSKYVQRKKQVVPVPWTCKSSVAFH